MLTQEQLAVIQQTVPVLQEHGETLTRHFYQRMFRENPEVRPYFNPAHQRSGRQQRALAGAVCAYAQHVDNPAVLADAVELIAQKHVSLGILPEHYPIVGENLLASIQEVLGVDAADPIIGAWGAAYSALADIFIEREAAIYAEQAETFGWQGFKSFVVTRREAEGDEVVAFYLRPEDGQPLVAHRPGQYVTLRVTLPDGGTLMRNYSLSNRPGDDLYRIGVKREAAPATDVPAGVCSNYLHQSVGEGDRVELCPPCGEFVLADEARSPLVLIAGGVGITPILSMLHEALEQGPADRPVVFIQCARNGALRPFADEIDALRKAHANLTVHLRYNEPSEQDRRDGAHDSEGLVDNALLDESVGEVPADYYFCGPEPMLRHLDALLRERGVPAEAVHYEFFGPAVNLAA